MGREGRGRAEVEDDEATVELVSWEGRAERDGAWLDDVDCRDGGRHATG